jgi:1-acyl-sn-glycerol-3-phosphate acyltransferase
VVTEPKRLHAIVACWRAFRVCGTVLHGFAQVALLFPWLPEPRRHRRVQIWARRVLQRLAVEVKLVGTPARVGPVLLVSNHISWLDIVVLHASCHCRFVSKADVERWPLIGTMAAGGGSLFVDRDSRRAAMRMVHRMADALRNSDVLAIFPEGTTSNGSSVLPFHSSLIQAAIWTDAPVQPVSLRYVDGRTEAASQDVRYIGDESLVGSIWRTLCAPNQRAVVAFGQPQRADGRERRKWAQDLRSEILAMRHG